MLNYDIEKVLTECEARIDAKIAEFNAAIKESKPTDAIDHDLKELEVSYAKEYTIKVFDGLRDTEAPLKSAIEMHSYDVIGHKVNRENGVPVNCEKVTDREKQIDLVKFCEFCKLPTDWQYMVEKFNKLLTTRLATELGLSAKKLTAINDSFRMHEIAEKLDMGETPDSNTAMCKQLQMIIDAILYEDNGKGKNVYRVNNRDVRYLLAAHTKRGKKIHSVSVAKNAYVHSLIANIANRVLTGAVYDVEYQIKKVKKTEEKVADKKAKAESSKARSSETAKKSA